MISISKLEALNDKDLLWVPSLTTIIHVQTVSDRQYVSHEQSSTEALSSCILGEFLKEDLGPPEEVEKTAALHSGR